MCHSTELVYHTWSVLKFWLFLGLFDRILGSFGLLNASPYWLHSWLKALTAWTITYKLYSGLKWSITFLPMQRNADLMFWCDGTKWTLSQVLKLWWLIWMYQVVFFVCWSLSFVLLFLSLRDFFFLHIGTILFLYCKHYHLLLYVCAFMCNNVMLLFNLFHILVLF